MTSRLSSERGAILIHVAVASIVLIAFSMFVIDYGVLWVSRGQAQNAADSGALAGAVALAFDDATDRTADGPAKQAALRFALLNKVFGEDPDVQVDTDIIFYNDDPTKFPDECADDTCIRVDVYRTNRDGRANPLPMWFGQLVGLNEQGVRATATARAMAGNAAQCVKPWVVADRWDENADGDGDPETGAQTWSQSSTFDIPEDGLPADPEDGQWDIYVPPTFVGDVFQSGSGFGKADMDGNLVDYGYQFILRMANPGGGSNLGIRSPGWVMTIDLPNGVGGEGLPPVEWNIRNCHTGVVAVADPADPCEEPSSEDPADYEDEIVVMTCLDVQTGNAWNPQEGALVDWIGESIDDYWDTDTNAPSNSGSNRIIPLALFDPQHYHSHDWEGTNGVAKVVNILGFFIEGTCGGGTDIDTVAFYHETYLACSDSGPANDLVGRLVTIEGDLVGGAGSVGPASFTQVIRLIR